MLYSTGILVFIANAFVTADGNQWTVWFLLFYKEFFSSINTGGRSNFVKLEKQEDTWEKVVNLQVQYDFSGIREDKLSHLCLCLAGLWAEGALTRLAHGGVWYSSLLIFWSSWAEQFKTN